MTEQDTSRLLILDAGSGEGASVKLAEVSQHYEFDLVRADINPEVEPDFVWDITQKPPDDHADKYDMVICNHVLEHLERTDVPEALANLRDCLKEGGELRLAVPSLEWVASQILSPDGANPIVLPVIYGQEEPAHEHHRCGFTLHWLRELVQQAGMIPRRANQGVFHLGFDGDEYLAVENVVVAARHKEFENVADDPASALD